MNIGDRMKMYERAFAGDRFMPMLPVLARIDGRAFHGFTKGLDRPFDTNYADCMDLTTIDLVKETNALMGYTQSDEITLLFYTDNIKSQIFFDGRIQKMVSQLGALSTLYFNKYVREYLGEEYVNRMPTFDARVWQVPTKEEAANVFLWRERDATKNSVSMAASCYYSHKEMHGKNGNQQQDMLFAKGINWNDYPARQKRGTYVQRRVVGRTFTVEELELLPKKHEARTNPDLVVTRTDYTTLAMPPFDTVTNKVGVLFDGEVPIAGNV